jgi:hypothetical protein
MSDLLDEAEDGAVLVNPVQGGNAAGALKKGSKATATAAAHVKRGSTPAHNDGAPRAAPTDVGPSGGKGTKDSPGSRKGAKDSPGSSKGAKDSPGSRKGAKRSRQALVIDSSDEEPGVGGDRAEAGRGPGAGAQGSHAAGTASGARPTKEGHAAARALPESGSAVPAGIGGSAPATRAPSVVPGAGSGAGALSPASQVRGRAGSRALPSSFVSATAVLQARCRVLCGSAEGDAHD